MNSSPQPRDERSTTPLLSLRGAAKAFGPVVALADGVVEILPGEIHALVGENGAGKSTLVKILAGLYNLDAGEFLVNEHPVVFRSVADSKAAGISVIYQEPTLFPDLTVAENIFIGRQPKNALGLINRSAMRKQARALFEQLGVRIDPDRLAEGLSIADQQIIEIAKAISLDASVLIMDEPTAALSGIEVERLFQVARALRTSGAGILFISHRFDEVFALCDMITVMRDGEYISTDNIDNTSVDEIVHRMVGRNVTELFPKAEAVIGEVVLDVSGLTSAGMFDDISFQVRSGEIVGLAGLVGAGRSEVARAVFGVDTYSRGTVKVGDTRVPRRDPIAAMNLGLALVPEDRRKQGLVVDSTVARNTTMAIQRTLT